MSVVEIKQGRPENKALQQERKTRILSAASKLFAKSGYSGTDLSILAKSIALSKGAIYYYFQNKKSLFLAAVDWMMGQLLENVNHVFESCKEPLLIIEQGVVAYLEFCAEHPEFVELLIHERSAFPEREVPAYFVYKESNTKPWHDLYGGLINRGYVRDIPIERISNVICDLLFGVIFTNHFSGRKISHVDQASDIVDIFFHGILTSRGLKKYKGLKHAKK